MDVTKGTHDGRVKSLFVPRAQATRQTIYRNKVCCMILQRWEISSRNKNNFPLKLVFSAYFPDFDFRGGVCALRNVNPAYHEVQHCIHTIEEWNRQSCRDDCTDTETRCAMRQNLENSEWVHFMTFFSKLAPHRQTPQDGAQTDTRCMRRVFIAK